MLVRFVGVGRCCRGCPRQHCRPVIANTRPMRAQALTHASAATGKLRPAYVKIPPFTQLDLPKFLTAVSTSRFTRCQAKMWLRQTAWSFYLTPNRDRMIAHLENVEQDKLGVGLGSIISLPPFLHFGRINWIFHYGMAKRNFLTYP